MSDYTPTTEEVREAIAEWTWSRRMFRPELAQSDGREFDRWCAEWEAEQGETEWEYGVSREVAIPMSSREGAERQIERMAKRPKGYRLTANLVRRRVTPWVAAPDTTNNESEDKR